MTIQEMFNKAYVGLRNQGFQQCTTVDESGNVQCKYTLPDKPDWHCAWGFVDTTLDANVTGTVMRLYIDGIGLAATLSTYELEFARRLQQCHDAASSSPPEQWRALSLCSGSGARAPFTMKRRLESLAVSYGLTIPA